jgi:hypothetical protein
MKRKSGRSNLLRRIEELETRWTDGSGLAPHSQAWLEYRDRQVYNYMTDQPDAPITVEGLRDHAWSAASRRSHEGDRQAAAKAGEHIAAGDCGASPVRPVSRREDWGVAGAKWDSSG